MKTAIKTWREIKMASSLLVASLFSQSVVATEDVDIDAILGMMTLEQKVGQLIQGEIQSMSPAEVGRYGIGSLLNGGGSYPNKNKKADVSDWLDMADSYFNAAVRLDNGVVIHPVWGTDAVHGHNNVYRATLFPHNIGLGAAADEELVERIAVVTAREVKATGADWVFAPTVAVAQDYRWGRTYESYASDPALVSRLGAAIVRGFESEGVATTAKHFLGDGGTLAGIDQGNVVGPLEVLKKPHLQAYEGVLAEGVPSIMASFNSWNGEKLHGSKFLLTDVLRTEMGYQGMVVSDWNGHGQVAGCNNASCAQSVNAGVDMLMVPQDWKQMRKNLLAQIAAGEISLDRVDQAVRRVLEFKQGYGLINGIKPSVRSGADLQDAFASSEHKSLAREAVRKSLVLLKNNGGVLPISSEARVAVVGSGADDVKMQMGGWSLTWQGTENNNSDFPEAQSVLAGFVETFANTSGEILTDPRDLSVDVAVVVFGEMPYAEGAGDVQNLVFKQGEHADLRLLKSYKKAGVPTVAVFLSGRPMWVNREINASDAFVAAWLPGSEGRGVAEVLVADEKGEPRYDFQGRLPFPWPDLDLNTVDKRLPVDQYLWKAAYGLSYNDAVMVEELHENAVSASAEKGDLVIFRKNTRPPLGLYLGDEGQWVMPISGSYGRSSLGELEVRSVDVRVQEDARSVVWSGAGIRDSQFYWKTTNDQGLDLRHILEADGALSMIMKIDQTPKGKVKLRMDCQWPCRGEVDVSKLFKRIPESQWLRLSFPLACFEDAGTDLSKVNGPMVLVTDNKMALTVLDVAVVRNPDKDSLVPCR